MDTSESILNKYFYCLQNMGKGTYIEPIIRDPKEQFFSSGDFAHMSAPLMYRMFKEKTKHPLHAAIKLKREDVVFLYLIEFGSSVSSIPQKKSHQYFWSKMAQKGMHQMRDLRVED